MNKDELRKIIKQRKRQFSSKQLENMSFCIMSKLLDHPKIKKAKTILIYHSLPDEVYTHSAILKLQNEGKTLVLPAVIGNGTMETREYKNTQELKTGAFNIKEPSGKQYTDLKNIDVAVIPGVAFDIHNNRLGRGKGYYDKFLPSIPQAYKIGICFDFQKLQKVPTDTNDICMDEVL